MSKLPILKPVQDQVLDIQHDTDPAKDHGPSRRIPHLGHTLLFFSTALTCVLLCLAAVLLTAHIHTDVEALQRPGLSLLGQALGYILTLLAAVWIFPRLWSKSFATGLDWNALAARRRWFWIVPSAVLVSGLAQLADHFVTAPKDDSIARIMSTAHGAWFLTLFGVILAPLTEEIAFRGFLLPALATAYDWLALDRTPAGLRQWELTSNHTTPALIFSAIFSSIPFALMHAGQLSHAWGALGILYAVSLVLSLVRIRTHSLACSVLFHSAYNLTIFTAIFIQTGGYRHLERLFT